MSSQNPKELRFFNADFLIINLAYVDHIGTAGAVFERMVAPERWEMCSDRECREKCPIYRNVKLIQDNLVTVRDRVLLAYRRMFEYGERLTLRQMSAHLAYMITAGLTDEQIASLSQSPNPKPMVNFLFFNRFFGDDGTSPDPGARQLKAIRSIAGQEFGLRPCPSVERKLWIRSELNLFTFHAHGASDDFEALRKAGARIAAGADVAPEKVYREADTRYGDKLFLSLSKKLGFIVPQRGPGARFVFSDQILRYLVLSLIRPGERCTLDKFKDRLFAHYGLAIDGEYIQRACIWSGYPPLSSIATSSDDWFVQMLRAGRVCCG